MTLSLQAKKPSPDEDIWDDSELIEAWETQSKLQNTALARRLAEKTNTKKFNTPVNSVEDPIPSTSKGTVQIFSVSDYCRATFEDGVDYEAKIMAITEGICTLKYIGYGNVAEVAIEDLVPSWGKKARKLQSAHAIAEKDSRIQHPSKKTKSHISFSEATSNMSSLPVGFVPPPPPLPPMLNGEDNEHLSAMLMSWYMSGYYTGLYQGMNKGKNSNKSSKKK